MSLSAIRTTPEPDFSPAEPGDDPRVVNDILALLDQTYLSEKVFGRPTHYDIAVSVACNIKCPFCPRQTFGAEIKSGLMKAEHYEPVLPHLETSQRTGLYGLGEPFLNKNFFGFLEAAKARGTYCMTSSHGMSLKDEVIEKILNSGLDELCVSMDGANKRTFEFLRDGAHFETVKRNVAKLIARRNERGQATPRVHIACAVSKYNVWQMAAMVRMTKELGADRLAFSNLVLDFPEHAHASIVGTRVFRFNLRRARLLAEKLGVDCVYFFQKPFPWKKEPPPLMGPGMRYGCPSAWRALIIERDGNIKPCCYLDTSFGNTGKAPLAEQFNSDTAVALRTSFLEKNYEEACKGCGQFTGISNERTWELIEMAERNTRDGNLREEVRERLLHVIAHFKELASAAAPRG